VRSLESVDGEEWTRMHANLMELLKVLPQPEVLASIVARLSGNAQMYSVCSPSIASDGGKSAQLDSVAISRVCLAAFLEYVFGHSWDPVLVISPRWCIKHTHPSYIASEMLSCLGNIYTSCNRMRYS
jgi:hypothetical protein